MKTLVYIFVVCLITGCGNKTIEITSDYIINENWDKQANAIKIQRMRLKKDSVIDLNNVNQVDIVNRLEEDSTFIYYANAKITPSSTYRDKKFYFNKDNGFYWWTERGNSKIRILGNLQKGNWYKFSHLVTYLYYIYVYVDSSNKIHRQDVNLSNY